MLIVTCRCPRCSDEFIVDRNVWATGTVRLRCPGCATYFLPEGSPGDVTPEEAARASVPLRIFDPEADAGT